MDTRSSVGIKNAWMELKRMSGDGKKTDKALVRRMFNKE